MERTLFCCLFAKGVTLTDLQEAEKTMKTDNKGREKKEEEKEAKLKKAEEGVRAVSSTERPALTLRDLTEQENAVFAGSELEVSHRQSAEVGPAGPHAAQRLLTTTSSRQERCTTLPAG